MIKKHYINISQYGLVNIWIQSQKYGSIFHGCNNSQKQNFRKSIQVKFSINKNEFLPFTYGGLIKST